MKFIDLFAGLGGFHVGLQKNGHECVFSCELDTSLRDLYKRNHGILPHGDIRTINEAEIPSHDILCAGFPCQPFSLAGKMKGAKCPESGKLIDHVIRIAKYHQPKFILLENVPQVLTIEDGKFWRYIKKSFSTIGYKLDYKIISPANLGIPQNRKRVFIVGMRQDMDINDFEWPSFLNEEKHNLKSILDNTLEHRKLEKVKSDLLNLWQDLLDNLLLGSLGGISIVAPEFGATYPEDFTMLSLDEMKKYSGAYGIPLRNCNSWEEIQTLMPSYTKNKLVPSWILKSVKFSRKLYQDNKEYCDQWAKKIDKTHNSWQILEWRAGKDGLCINDQLVQFRASGIRILRTDAAPSLIAMTPTQIPVIPSESRYISKHEAAKLQYLHGLKFLPEETNSAFKALGNAVNAKIIELISYKFNQLSLG